MNTIQTNPCAPGTLSVNDKCMFIDLYCKGSGILAVLSKSISENNFTIRPNPSTGIIIVTFGHAPDPYSSLVVSDILGNILTRIRIKDGENQNVSVDMKDYPSGAYIIKYQDNKGGIISGLFHIVT